MLNDARFPELPGKTFDLNVFFGSESEFDAFASTGANAALNAALGKDIPSLTAP